MNIIHFALDARSANIFASAGVERIFLMNIFSSMKIVFDSFTPQDLVFKFEDKYFYPPIED